MLYARGDLRYIAIVAPSQYGWIREHLDLVHTEYQMAGHKLTKPTFGVKSESWEWTIEEQHAPLVFDATLDRHLARRNITKLKT